jgi:threonine dehydrogenase-like Zn-dependent dehydrogenase
LVLLPDQLTYTDGAQVACTFGTVFEGLEKIGIDGKCSVLVTGLGPVGLAALQLSRALGSKQLIGVDAVQERLDLAMKLGLADAVFLAGPSNVEQIKAITGGHGCERSVDCSGNADARRTCIQATRKVKS